VFAVIVRFNKGDAAVRHDCMAGKCSAAMLSLLCSPCLLQVLQDDVPLPPPGTVSELCRDFLALCLQRDPSRRPAATALLTHPWVAQAAATDVKGLMKRTMFCPEDRCASTADHCMLTGQLGRSSWHYVEAQFECVSEQLCLRLLLNSACGCGIFMWRELHMHQAQPAPLLIGQS
jgi:serine/threonine protein kinase